jgi:hypothetical protein
MVQSYGLFQLSENSHVVEGNSHAAHETPFRPVSSAVYRRRVVLPIFFENTTNSESYADTAHVFLSHISEDRIAQA